MTDQHDALVEAQDSRLWCIHHIGPDDVMAAPNFDTAWAWAEWGNKTFAQHKDISRFVVAIWPHDAETHAVDLPKSIAEWTLPVAGPTQPSGEGRGDFRCHNCNAIVSSVVAPSRCPECRCRDFSAVAPSSVTRPAHCADEGEAAIRHDERKKIIAQGCIHTRKATQQDGDGDRADIRAWQEAGSQWFDPSICEIVSEYAAWRDKRPTTPAREAIEAAAKVQRLEFPDGSSLRVDYPDSKDWAKSWTFTSPTGGVATQEQDWEVVEHIGLTAILESHARALALPSNPGEPVAWLYTDPEGNSRARIHRARHYRGTETPLYRHPPAASGGEVERLREAAKAIVDRRFSTYKARNGREVGIQGDDGEKVWLVHSDDMFALEQALASHPDEADIIIAKLDFKMMREAIDGIADDWMSSKDHHQGWVLIPEEKFSELRVADRIMKMREALSTHAGNGGQSEGEG